MKKLFIALVAVAFSTAVFAQAEKKAETKPATTSEKPMPTHCYAMKNSAMVHCMGATEEPMTKDATLKNGTMVSTKGSVKMKDGKTVMLKNGECIDMAGKIGNYDKVHANMKMDTKKKM